MNKTERTFLTIWISLATFALIVIFVLLGKGIIVKEPTFLSINNLVLCNGEKIVKVSSTMDSFYLQENSVVFCGDLVVDSPIYLLGYLFYETTEGPPVGKFSDLDTRKSGPLRVEVTTTADILPGKYIFQIYQARKIIAEYVFWLADKAD